MIKELHEKLLNKETTALKLTREYLDQIKAKDRELEAFLDVDEEGALAAAHEIDEKISRGQEIDLLAGIPCALKDNLCVKGSRTTAASKILENYVAPYDATVVKRLRENDAIFLGKTNMDEFAMGSSTESSAYQKTKNPLDLQRVPGGSSGGSASAVAAGETAWALGSDTGGSIRQPASFCGVVGLKPTYGRVSRHGLIAMASSLDQIGPLTKTVEDAAIVLTRIAGRDAHDATTARSADKAYEDFLSGDVRGKKIGIPKEYLEGLSEDIRQVFQRSVDKLSGLGVEVKEISLPHTKFALPTYYIIMTSEVSSNLARFDGIKYGLRASGGDIEKLLDVYLKTRRDGFGPEVKRRIMLGTYALSAGYYDAYYLKAQKVRGLIRKDFERVFEEVDYVYSPTAPETAFRFGEKTEDLLKMYLSDIYTVTANLAGVPAISFPIGGIRKQEGESVELPLGGQLMGKWFDEEGLLNLAHTFEIS